jgi:hypothetical protein
MLLQEPFGCAESRRIGRWRVLGRRHNLLGIPVGKANAAAILRQIAP